MTLIWHLYCWLTRCRHAHTTWPQTHGGKCTCACLKCGAAIDYDWRTMRRRL